MIDQRQSPGAKKWHLRKDTRRNGTSDCPGMDLTLEVRRSVAGNLAKS